CNVAQPQGRFAKDDKQWKEKQRKHLEPLIGKAKQWLFDAGFSFNQMCCMLMDETQDLSATIVQKANAGNYDSIVIGRRGLSVYKEFVSRRVGEKIFKQAEHLTVWVFG
ncbi:MAG: universal stress protein, partial [Desulfatitalea sp.]|nr:universal stress protein [Desulfatitalea sp.]NNJ98862.1 universal stress protein [Desulfatitalea sp.]